MHNGICTTGYMHNSYMHNGYLHNGYMHNGYISLPHIKSGCLQSLMVPYHIHHFHPYHLPGRVVKCQIFYTDTNLSSKFTPKTRNSRLICFRDKTRKSWSIEVVVGLVCYFRRPIGYLHRIWVEWKCVWVKITHWNIEFRIWAKCTGVWGKIAPTILAVFIKLYPTSERVCYNQRFYPRPPKNLHRLICPICDISQLW